MSLDYNLDQNVETVIELLTDPDFLVERSIGIGELEADAEIAEDEDGKVYVSMTRKVQRDLPSFLAKIFDPKQTLQMEETWTPNGDSWSGKGVYTVEGQPVEIKTEFSLTPNGSGSTYSIKYAAKAKIPMIGGKVEKFIKSNCEDGTTKEIDFLKTKFA